MNVIIVNGGSDLYGASRILLHVMKMLRPRKVILLVPKGGLLTDEIASNGEYAHIKVIVEPSIPVIYRKMGIWEALKMARQMIVFRSRVKKIIRDEQIDWAYVNTLSCLFAMRVLKSCRLKIWLHVHEILENDRVSTRSINTFAIKWADRIIAVSEPVRNNLIEASNGGEAATEKIITILNGIPDKHCPSFYKSANEKNVIVTLFARIKPEKGIWFFLDTIALLPEEIRNLTRFVIAGGPAPGGEHYLNQLLQDIKLHPAARQIEFRSFIPDITVPLNETDVLVVPSLMKDPFPTTILEGLSAGKPVIATNTGGSVQSVKEGETGFLIEPGDKETFVGRLTRLLESKTLREKMGTAAREDFLYRFTFKAFENNMMKQVNVFEDYVNGHRGSLLTNSKIDEK